MFAANRLLTILPIVAAWPIHAQPTAKIDFARDIQPLFREHCVECHGPSQQMRGLRVDRRRDLLPNRVGANGARVVPGSTDRSPLYRRVTATDAARRMPPSGPLKPEQVDLIKAWIDQGAEWPDALSGEGDSNPPDATVVRLRDALRSMNAPLFRQILNDRPEVVNARGPQGWTPLMYAALYGEVDAVRVLLDKGASPNARNNHGATALMYGLDSEAKSRLLLERGADPNVRSGEGRTALLIAASQAGSYAVVKLLLEHGAKPDVRLSDGRGVLSVAISARDPNLLQLLLKAGADKRALPLSPLLVNRCEACFDLLLPIAEASDLSAGLTGTIRRGDLPRMQALLDRGAKPSPTLLQTVAASRAQIPAAQIKALIAAGADVNTKTLTGLDLHEFASRNGNAALSEVLQSPERRVEGPIPSSPATKLRSPRAAVESVLPALQRSDEAFIQKAGCVSCHNNSLTAMTVVAARAAGLKVNDQIANAQPRRIVAFLEENAERGLENEGIPGLVDTVSYILLGLSAAGYPSDPTTDVWARFIKNSQSADGSWACLALRPPLESSDIQVTAASIRSLKAYGLTSRKADYDEAVARAVRWLEAAPAPTTEDMVYQILGLIWGDGSPAVIRSTATRLQSLQRKDGGWSQIPALRSDPYATGEALVALHEARALSTESPAYRSGMQFLLKVQLGDGSWHVASRAAAIQPYFDSEFPHGTDQFISAAASNWASMALLKAVR